MTRRTSLIDASVDPRYAALEQRVYGVEQTLQGISAQISGLASKWDERGRTQWPTIFSAMGVLLAILVTIGGMAWLPIKQAQERSDRDIMGLRTNALSIAAFQDFRATYDSSQALLRQDSEARFSRLEDELKILRATTATHAETGRQIGDLQRQLDQLRDELKALR